MVLVSESLSRQIISLSIMLFESIYPLLWDKPVAFILPRVSTENRSISVTHQLFNCMQTNAMLPSIFCILDYITLKSNSIFS